MWVAFNHSFNIKFLSPAYMNICLFWKNLLFFIKNGKMFIRHLLCTLLKDLQYHKTGRGLVSWAFDKCSHIQPCSQRALHLFKSSAVVPRPGGPVVWSVIPYTNRLRVQFSVGAFLGCGVWSPVRGCIWFSYLHFSLSLSPLSLSLKSINMFFLN